ncbi:MAG: NADH-quinone oxidoreductase subunit M [Thermoleophilaceae bacterium]|nr:NADH-quinone oxidoreductase subunit M [Thermoleophilaceae bacterium]
MNWGLTILLIVPLVGALIAALMPLKQVGSVAGIMTLIQVGFLVPIVLNFTAGTDLTGYVNESWIPQLGVHYSLGIDGLNLFMICLVVLAWSVATFAASRHEYERPRMFYAMLALAEVGTLGAFMAQDLILFVLFFDLLLIPFYFLIGMWGRSTELGDARRATAIFMIYTLAGSLLMLVSAVALGVLSSSQNNVPLSFDFVDLASNTVTHETQNWIFLGFMIALLVKMPIPPLHGWMPITYKSTPLPVLIALSAVVAKLGAYGFLRVVLPLMPHSVEAYQPLLLIFAVIAIVYGSVMAFSQDDTRLVVGYSSVAQIGFVLLGIFAIDPKGAEGAILQMVNHGIVVIALFLIIGFLADRAGSEKLSDMGGLAKRAPFFATMFLIVSLATLAMPGSANFVGETYILFGAFQTKFVWGVVASIGVVLAAVYMLRFFQRAMHNRGSAGDEETDIRARELDSTEFGLLLPAVLIILALAVYPQYLVERVEPNAKQAVNFVTSPLESPATTARKDPVE